MRLGDELLHEVGRLVPSAPRTSSARTRRQLLGGIHIVGEWGNLASGVLLSQLVPDIPSPRSEIKIRVSYHGYSHVGCGDTARRGSGSGRGTAAAGVVAGRGLPGAARRFR